MMNDLGELSLADFRGTKKKETINIETDEHRVCNRWFLGFLDRRKWYTFFL